jgi:hypothetical protein
MEGPASRGFFLSTAPGQKRITVAETCYS